MVAESAPMSKINLKIWMNRNAIHIIQVVVEIK